MILHQIESLAAAGVTDIVLAVNYRPEVMIKVLQQVRSYPSPMRGRFVRERDTVCANGFISVYSTRSSTV